jgi:hypothetical protein
MQLISQLISNRVNIMNRRFKNLVKERPGRATELKEIKSMIPELLKAASLVGILDGTD